MGKDRGLIPIESVEEIDDLGSEATTIGLIRSYLEEYLTSRWTQGVASLAISGKRTGLSGSSGIPQVV